MFWKWIKVLMLQCDVNACDAISWETSEAKEAWQIHLIYKH
jgi:hypothetical protein